MKNKYIMRLLAGGLLYAGGLAYEKLFDNYNIYVYAGIFIAAYIISGYDVLYKALCGIFGKDIFNENFLMAIATIGAFSIGDFAEGVAVMLFYQLGEYFQDKAVANSRRSITDLMSLRADYANLITGGASVKTDPRYYIDKTR